MLRGADGIVGPPTFWHPGNVGGFFRPPFTPRKVLHDAASPAPKRKRPWFTAAASPSVSDWDKIISGKASNAATSTSQGPGGVERGARRIFSLDSKKTTVRP